MIKKYLFLITVHVHNINIFFIFHCFFPFLTTSLAQIPGFHSTALCLTGSSQLCVGVRSVGEAKLLALYGVV